MTEKQEKLVKWIERTTRVKYNPKENLSDYINEWRPKAEQIEQELREESEEMNLRLEMENEIMNG